MLLDEIKKLNRGQKAYVNVATYIGIYPSSYITYIEKINREQLIVIRVNYENRHTDKTLVHTYTFYKSTEYEEAEEFLELLKASYSNITILERSE